MFLTFKPKYGGSYEQNYFYFHLGPYLYAYKMVNIFNVCHAFVIYNKCIKIILNFKLLTLDVNCFGAFIILMTSSTRGNIVVLIGWRLNFRPIRC